jgi:N-acetylglucosamine kinase-like BadF-type ATPase
VPYYLGIDGGGTKTTSAIGDESKRLATATAGPSNIVRVGEATTRESLHQAVRQACAAAGIAPDQIVGTCIGGSGAARPELAAIVREFLGEIIQSPIEVVGDMQIALEAAFGSGPGVIVNAGTGSFAYGRDANGRTARAGGWGFAIGDEGSAHWIGRSAVAALLRSSDATDDAANSPLAKAFFKTWGVATISDLARAANAVPPPDFAALFRAVVANKDAITSDVLSHAGRELAHTAEIVLRRLFSNETGPVPVAIMGSVFRHSEQVGQVFYNELRKLDPRVAVSFDIVDPIEGALRMARRAAKGA